MRKSQPDRTAGCALVGEGGKRTMVTMSLHAFLELVLQDQSMSCRDLGSLPDE